MNEHPQAVSIGADIKQHEADNRTVACDASAASPAQDEAAHAPPGASRDSAKTVRDELTALVAEFEQQRENWELLRQQEQSRLRQEGDTLCEAWQRLEDEQRRLLAERERLRNGVGAAASHGPTASADLVQNHQEYNSDRSPARGGRNPTESSSTTWWQLEQLRLEIQKHARREA